MKKQKFNEYAANDSKVSGSKKIIRFSQMLNNSQAKAQPMTKSMVNWMKYQQDPYQRNKNFLLDSNSKISLETKFFGDSFGTVNLNGKADDSVGNFNDSCILKQREPSIDVAKKESSSCLKRPEKKFGFRPSMGRSPVSTALALLKNQIQTSKTGKGRRMGEKSKSRRPRNMSVTLDNMEDSPDQSIIIKGKQRGKRGKRKRPRRKTDEVRKTFDIEMKKRNYRRLKNNIMKQKIQKMMVQSNLSNLKNELDLISNLSTSKNKEIEHFEDTEKLRRVQTQADQSKRKTRKVNRKHYKRQRQSPLQKIESQNTRSNAVRQVNQNFTVDNRAKKDELMKNRIQKVVSGGTQPGPQLVHTVRIINRSMSRKKLNASSTNRNHLKAKQPTTGSEALIQRRLKRYPIIANPPISKGRKVPKKISEYGELMKAATMEIKRDFGEYPMVLGQSGMRGSKVNLTGDSKLRKGCSEYTSKFSLLKAERQSAKANQVTKKQFPKSGNRGVLSMRNLLKKNDRKIKKMSFVTGKNEERSQNGDGRGYGQSSSMKQRFESGKGGNGRRGANIVLERNALRKFKSRTRGEYPDRTGQISSEYGHYFA